MRDGYLRGSLSRPATRRQMDVLAAYVAVGGSVLDAAEHALPLHEGCIQEMDGEQGGHRRKCATTRADPRAKSGFSTEQLIYAGRAAGWLVVPSLEPS